MKAIVRQKSSPKVIAKRGRDSYLVDIGNGKGRIVDLGLRVAYPATNLKSTLARGYWEDFNGSYEESERVLDML